MEEDSFDPSDEVGEMSMSGRSGVRGEGSDALSFRRGVERGESKKWVVR